MNSYINAMFQGRLSRLQYVVARVYYSLIFFVLMLLTVSPVIFLGTLIDSAESGTSTAQYVLIAAGGTVVLIWYLVGAMIEVSLIIRRLHDINKPWWFIVFAIIPVINILFSFYILFMPGTEGSNDYGKRIKGYYWRLLMKIPSNART